jgi:hypothetical protein
MATNLVFAWRNKKCQGAWSQLWFLSDFADKANHAITLLPRITRFKSNFIFNFIEKKTFRVLFKHKRKAPCIKKLVP